MVCEWHKQLCLAVEQAELKKNPFSYFYVDGVFPEDFYQELIDSFPDPAYYRTLYTQRLCLSLLDEQIGQLPFAHALFWSQFASQLKSNQLIAVLVKKFEAEMKARFGDQEVQVSPDLGLTLDNSDYAIQPHTDHPQKILSLLFYLPRDSKQKHLGTSIYRPNNPSLRCEGLKYHPFEDFTKIYTAPFKPNSLFGFFKSDCSFHGVEPIGKQSSPRHSLSYQLLLP